MSAKFYTLLTDIGAAKLASAAALGVPLKITHMAVGSGGGVLPTPNAQQTALVAEERRAALNMLYVDPQNSSQIIAEQVIPENEGGWWIREVGLFDETGALIAVGNCPESYKPKLAEGSGRTQTVRMVLITSSTDNITLKIDPAVVLATRKYVDDKVLELKVYVDDLMAKHLAAVDPHSQYAPKDSPTLTGTPKAPTATAGNNSTQLANTAFVQAAILALIGGAPATLDTLKEIAAAINNDPNFSITINNALALKAPLASPALTGAPTAPTATQSTNNTQIATTAFVKAALAGLVGSSPAALDTLNELAAALGNDPNFATTVMNALAGKQPLDTTLTNLSGKSISGLLEYLHLEETVKLAKNALPLSGGRLTGPVSLLNENGKRLQIETAGNPTSNVFVVFTGTNERPCLIECKDETSYHFFSQRNPDGTITFQTAGKMIPLDYSNFDAKYQAKGNYAVKGDSYTKEETNLKFENEKISGVGPFSFLDKTSGLILKAAGVTFATEGDRVTFPEAFPNVCRAVVLTLNGSAGESTRNIVATNVSRTGFSIARGSNEAGVFWMAIGV